ncbi:MAG: DNA polymerase III subunit beta, partial [Candidatus Regiella insecticola]|nr:DNA polymerase III subunit beta [Candidatus Regiella insecticola]
EIEMVATIALSQSHKTETGSTTVPARKFFDIFRGLPEDAEITVTLEAKRLSIRSGHSRFFLSILPASDFPNLADLKKEKEVELTVSPAALKC